ncbi:MAG: hypothetical protein ACP5HW_02035 [Candidatus Micrarchaeia archaeon]
MRLLKSNGLVIVLTQIGDKEGCPTMKVNGRKIKLSDDYYGSIKLSKKLAEAFTKI